METFTIGVILPHCQLFGGVRRFFELGALFIRKGHRMIVLTPDGKAPTWTRFSGTIDKISNLSDYSFSLLFITEPVFLEPLLRANSKVKVFYHVGPGADLTNVLKHREIVIFSNSENMYLHDRKKYGIETIRQTGGVYIPLQQKQAEAHPDPFMIMCYGRLSRPGKGTHIVTKAAEKLYKKGYSVKLLLFDSPLDEKGKQLIRRFKPKVPFEFILDHPVENNAGLFQRADVFVAVERKGGWSNTAAEALAAGVPLVGGNTGTRDFLIDGVTGLRVWRHWFFVERAILALIRNPELRMKLAANGREKMKEYSWPVLADNILAYLKQSPARKSAD